MSDFRFQPWPGTIAITAFLAFCSWLHSPRKGGEKMDMIPRNDYGERCQFDAYCKLVLYHEAIDYLREMQRRRDTVSYPYL